MDDWTPIVVAVLGTLGAGGLGVAIIHYALSRRQEGVSHSPGDIVFERQDKILTDLQTQSTAQLQMISTMGKEISQLREALNAKGEEVYDLKVKLRAAVQRADELEFNLNEERTRRVDLETELHDTLARMASAVVPKP